VAPDSPIQTTEEIQNDPFPNQDEPIDSSSPSPIQTSPVQTSPVQTSPVQTSPVQTSPVQTSPVQTSPVQTSPVQTSPVQPLPPMILTEKSTITQKKSAANPVQHRHTASLERALESFRSHIPLDGWNFHSEVKGIKIYMKEAGKSTPIMRGHGVIAGGFTTYDILSVIKSLKLCTFISFFYLFLFLLKNSFLLAFSLFF
jgi:hypothetical protein